MLRSYERSCKPHCWKKVAWTITLPLVDIEEDIVEDGLPNLAGLEVEA